MCPFLRKFCVSVTAIFAHYRFVHENVKLCLFESFSLSLLTYGLNAVFMSKTQLNKLNAAWNNVSRKTFGCKQWESVKEIQYLCCRLDFISLIDFYKFTFLYKSKKLNTHVVHSCLDVGFKNVKLKRLYFSCNICVGHLVFFEDVFDIFVNSDVM